jgi:hypothetical protein
VITYPRAIAELGRLLLTAKIRQTAMALLACVMFGATSVLAQQVSTPVQPILPSLSEVGPIPTEAPSFQSQIDRALGRVKPPITLAESGVSLLDTAVVATQLRMRFDAAYDWQMPDRAEMLWAKTGGRGPALAETSVDYQQLSLYGEYALGGRWGVFAELPLWLIDPVNNDNTGGLGDGNVGFKFGLFQEPEALITLQLRTIFPSGSGRKGLGARHVSLEPGALAFYRLGKYMAWEGELRDIIPLNGTPGFAGNVIRYGTGLTYSLYDTGVVNVQSVAEIVGWTLTGGDVTIVDGPGAFHTSSAAGDTIITSAVGVRGTVVAKGSVYFGYARALTKDRWYTDLLRVEARWQF